MVYAFITKNVLEIQTGFVSAKQIHKFNFGVLFADFFKFYGYKIDYNEIIINPNGRQFYINKNEYLEYQKNLNLQIGENKVSNNNFGYNCNLNNFENNTIHNNNIIKIDEYSSWFDKIKIEEFKNANNSRSYSQENSWGYNNDNNFSDKYNNKSDNYDFNLWSEEENEEARKNIGSPKDTIEEAYSSCSIPDDSALLKQKRLASDFNYDLPYEDELRKNKHKYFIDKNGNFCCKKKNISSNLYILGLDDKNPENVARNLYKFWVVHDYIKTIRDHLFYPSEDPFVSYFESFVDNEILEKYRNLNKFN
jgi:hypothetical protein